MCKDDSCDHNQNFVVSSIICQTFRSIHTAGLRHARQSSQSNAHLEHQLDSAFENPFKNISFL